MNSTRRNSQRIFFFGTETSAFFLPKGRQEIIIRLSNWKKNKGSKTRRALREDIIAAPIVCPRNHITLLMDFFCSVSSALLGWIKKKTTCCLLNPRTQNFAHVLCKLHSVPLSAFCDLESHACRLMTQTNKCDRATSSSELEQPARLMLGALPVWQQGGNQPQMEPKHVQQSVQEPLVKLYHHL